MSTDLNSAQRARDVQALHDAVTEHSKSLFDEKVLKPGLIVFRAADGSATDLCVLVHASGVDVGVRADATDEKPALEVWGEPRRLESIVRGEKDARKQFFAGGIQVRGDMRYLSELGMRLGFLDQPIV